LGGNDTPTRNSGRDPATDGRISPVGRHPAVKALGVCPICLGAGTVVNLGGTGDPTGTLVEAPCPACAA
jgi:hypothetical protein